jgi:uncharacterized RDD family membrane protein YckC
MASLIKKRIYAFLIDMAVIYFLKFFSLVIYLKTIATFLGALPDQNKENLFTNLYLLDNYLFIVLFIGYFISCFFITNGKTLGKIIFNLEIKNPKEDETFFDQYLLRTFAYLFCYLNGVFLLLIPLFTKDGKGIPDWVSGTEVVTDNESHVKRSDYAQNESFNLKKLG